MNLCAWLLRRLSQLVLILNALVFVVASAVMTSGQERMAVFLKFPWGSFLTELNSIMHLGMLDARSVWIAWLFLNGAITFSVIGRPRVLALRPTHAHQDVARLVKSKAHQIESDPHLKQSLKKLNQLLNKP